MQLVDAVSSHPFRWDDSSDGFTQFTSRKLTRKAFVWKHSDERIYISNILSAEKYPDLFFFTSM